MDDLHIPNNYINSYSLTTSKWYDDYALIDLDKPLGANAGWMIPDDFYNQRGDGVGSDGYNTFWFTSGFPGGNWTDPQPKDGANHYEWYTYATGSYGLTADEWLRGPIMYSTKVLYSNLFISPGDSGSPLWPFEDYVADSNGIKRELVYGIADAEGDTFNMFQTIDSQRLGKIMHWEREDKDEQPLAMLGYSSN
jgi:hypothetical protein